MNRRERIVETVHRLAEVSEKQALLAVNRARAAQEEAERVRLALEAENAQAEAHLTQGAMSGMERELLWAHRAWYRQQLEHSEERIALTEAEVAAATERLNQRKQETRIRERVRDHVTAEERSLRDERQQRELDEVAARRSPPRPLD